MSNEPLPSREQIAYDMSEIIRREHDIHGTRQITSDGLNNALTAMAIFVLKPTPVDEKIPYQYQLENQTIFESNQIIISSALDKVDTVLNDLKTKMYQLEKNQHQVMMQNSPEPIPVQSPTPESKERKSIFPSLRTPKPIPLNPNDPYQSSLEQQRKTIKLVDDWNLFVEWQTLGVEYWEDFSRIAYDEYLSIHRTMFRSDIEPNLMRIYSQGLNLVLMQEKILATQYGSSMMKEIFSTRNDFPQ